MTRFDDDRGKVELKLKLEYLLYDKHPQGIARTRANGLRVESYPSLAEAIGIGKVNHSQVHWGEGRLSDRVTGLVLHVYGIPEDDDCAAEFRDGYARIFIREFERLHPRTDADQPPSEDEPRSSLVPIMAGPRQKPKDSKPVGLASVVIEGSQYGLGTVAIEITIACGIWKGATLQSGRVALDCSPANMMTDSFRNWVGKTRVFETSIEGGGKGRVLLAFGSGGNQLAPAWRVTAIEGSVGTFWVDPDFAAIEGLSPGNRVIVTFGTWLSEIEETDEAPRGDGFVLVDDDGQQLKLPPEELSKKKRRVMAAIAKAILDPKPDGYVELASHALVVVERKS